MSGKLKHQYTYYFYRLQNVQAPRDNLLNSYYHYIKWLNTKGAPFTASDLLYQLKIINAYFIDPKLSLANLSTVNPLERASLNTLIDSNLKSRNEYRSLLKQKSFYRSLFTLALGLTLTFSFIFPPVSLIPSSFGAIKFLFFTMSGIGLMCGSMLKTLFFSEYEPTASSFFRSDAFLIPAGILSVGISLFAPLIPGFAASEIFTALLLIPGLVTLGVAMLATANFVNKPLAVEKTPLKDNPDQQLSTQLTQFCQLQDPSDNLKVAVEATTQCLLHGYKKNMEEPAMDLGELEKELASKLSPQ